MLRSVALGGRTVYKRGLRVNYIDILRLTAAIEMVYGHSIDVFLLPALRQTRGYETWNEFRGLTSVAFLFVSGFSFFQAATRTLDNHRGKPLLLHRQKRLRRGLILIGLGYLMHPPNFHRISEWRGWLPFFEVDILQCTGLLIVMFETLIIVSRSVHLTAWIAACIVPLSLLAPLRLETHAFPEGLRPFTNYLQHTKGSLFPILPWAMHFAMGYWVAYTLRNTRPSKHGWGLLLWTFVLQAVVYWIWYKGWMPTSPGWTALISISRLMPGVLAGAVGCWLLRISDKTLPWLAPFTGHTLVIYVVHMQLLFNLFWGLKRYHQQQLDWVMGSILSTAVLIVSLAAAFYYDQWERSRPQQNKTRARPQT